MITPRFSCSQTPESIIVTIYCPSIRASDVEITIDDTLVTVHVNPYYLRLNFSKPLVEDDECSANYDPTSGNLTVTLSKAKKGEDFQDLDLLSKLLAPRQTAQKAPPSIEVLASESASPEDDLSRKIEGLALERDEILEAADNDWQLPQTVPGDTAPLSAKRSYGFLDKYSDFLCHASQTENEANELGDSAEVFTRDERRQARIKHEEDKWDGEYYMADFMEDENIRELLRWEHPHVIDTNPVEYSEEEKLTMLRLPRKEYICTAAESHDLYLTLVTLLLSYAYDARTTQHDPTSESAWTICTLTPAFSALDPPFSKQYEDETVKFTDSELGDVLATSYRRLLAFPLYRSFILAEECRKDVAKLLRKGKRTVVRCLLELKSILDHNDVYYVYSKIWVDDFCVWVQTNASEDLLESLGVQLMGVKVHKSFISWGLEELERTAIESLERESDSDDE